MPHLVGSVFPKDASNEMSILRQNWIISRDVMWISIFEITIEKIV